MEDYYISKNAIKFLVETFTSDKYLKKTFNNPEFFRQYNLLDEDLTIFELTADIRMVLLPKQKHHAYTLPTDSLKVIELYNLNELLNQIINSNHDTKHRSLRILSQIFLHIQDELKKHPLTDRFNNKLDINIIDYLYNWLQATPGYNFLKFYQPDELNQQIVFKDKVDKYTAFTNLVANPKNINTLSVIAKLFNVSTKIITEFAKYLGLDKDDFEINHIAGKDQAVLTDNFINKLKQYLIVHN